MQPIIKAEIADLDDDAIQAIRSESIGSSDVASVMCGYGVDVLLRKQGLIDGGSFDNLDTRVGKACEQLVADECGRRIVEEYPGAEVNIEPTGVIVQHPEIDYRTSSPDFFITVNHKDWPYSQQLGLLETKTTGAHLKSKWEDGPC